MDIRMPGMDGIAATRAITGDDDLAGVKVVVLTTFEIDAYVIEADRAGASGFLSKSIEPADLLDAIRTVAGGDALLSPKQPRRSWLSPRQPAPRPRSQAACSTP
jgi:DNA-binding NarL/FixJ family response regulator